MQTVNLSQALLGAAVTMAGGVLFERLARRLRLVSADGLKIIVAGAVIAIVLYGAAWWVDFFAWVRGSLGMVIAAICATAAVFFFAMMVRRRIRYARISRRLLRLLNSEVRADREAGYVQLSEQVAADLPPDLERFLRTQVEYDGGDYGDRERAVRLLRQAHRLEGLHAPLAVTLFRDPNLPETFSAAICAVFADRREDLDALVTVLEQQPLPDPDERRNDGIATLGFRLSQAFGAVRSALQFDRVGRLEPAMRARLLAIAARLAAVPQLEPLLADIRRELE